MLGVLLSIPMGGLCAACHGDPAQIQQPVRYALSRLCPQDQAVGFVPGDLRGWFWGEVH